MVDQAVDADTARQLHADAVRTRAMAAWIVMDKDNVATWARQADRKYRMRGNISIRHPCLLSRH